MKLKDEVVCGRVKSNASASATRVGVALAGLATAMAARPGLAQQAAAPAELPPVEVTAAKKKAKAKPVAQKKAPAPKQVAAPPPVQQPPAAEPSETAAGFGDGSGTTPASGNTLQSGTGLGRLQGTLQDTPQTVNTISQEQIKQQNINQLDQALRNVPGVTVNVGEGGGGMNGDQFRIRGFQAKGDIYVDGLRDFGVYVRDSFAYEQVDVIKGPSSESFGMGTTGGAINIQQKKAHKGDSSYVEGALGTDSFYRTMIDVNKQLTDTIAARAVAMYHDQEFADRDHVFSERFGFLGSLAFGLGTDTEWTVNYLHQNGERLPDMGVPIVDLDGATFPGSVGSAPGRPVTEYGADRSNFYGKSTDIDDYSVNMLTSRLTHKYSKNFTFFNDTRLAHYERFFAQTVVSCTSAACINSVANGTFDGAYAYGGPAGFDQEAWGIQNIATGVAKFKTGWLRHEAVAGIDLFYQEDDRTTVNNYDAMGNIVPNSAKGFPGTIGNPNFVPNYRPRGNPLALKAAEADNVGLFASDRVWLTEQFSVLGGVRWDSYRASYRATNPQTGLWTGTSPAAPPVYADPTSAADVDTESQFTSPKASVIWEPAKNQTYYASWAKSYSPVGQFITNDNASVPTTPNQNNQEPEENELWELGAKISTPDGRLGFTAALFRVDKGNATYAGDAPGTIVLSGESQRVQGVELGMTGSVTDAWTVQLAYAYLDSEVLESNNANAAQAAYIEGNEVPFVAEHNVSLWTTYELSMHLAMSGKWLIGGGVVYTDDYFTNSLNFAMVPANFTFDAMTSYEVDGWRFAVNGYNLSDELNYDAAFSNRVVVAPGRSAVVTVGKKF
jgi:catecholate siderophore receptor